MKKIILYLVLLLIIGCDGAEIYFESPQPANSEREKIFPTALQGIYNDDDDGSLIINELTCVYRDDTILDMEGQLYDSLILKKYKSHYILNQTGEEGWIVWVIYIKNIDKFAVQSIGGAMDAYEVEDVEKLKNLTTVNEIFNSNGHIDYYLINPTQKEFKRLVKKKIMFSEKVTFKRVNK